MEDLSGLLAAGVDNEKEHFKVMKALAMDALSLVLAQAEPDPSERRRYAHARDQALPLLLRLEDHGEREAALGDVARSFGVGKRALRSALVTMTRRDASKEHPRAASEEPGPEPGESDDLAEEVERLLRGPGVLDRLVESAARVHGVVGDREHLKLQALVALGAQLAPLPNGRPAGGSLVIMGEPGRGKNFICDAIARVLPERFCLRLESASAKSLYYRAEGDSKMLQHRWIYPNEAEATDRLVEMLRPLLSSGEATHLTVNKEDGRNAAQELRVEGPVSVTIPTIREKLDWQLQTRLLVSELKDFEGRVAEHSRAVSRQLLPNLASQDHGGRIRLWRTALQSLTGVRRVVFPVDHKDFCYNSDAPSYGARLWGNLLGLLLAHAWLEQHNREVLWLAGGEAAVVAAPEDYAAAHRIFSATCRSSAVKLSQTHKNILDAVHELQEHADAHGCSQRRIAEKAGVHHSTVGEHRSFLVGSAKFLEETANGRLRLVPGTEPSRWHSEGITVSIPSPGQVKRWWHASV